MTEELKELVEKDIKEVREYLKQCEVFPGKDPWEVSYSSEEYKPIGRMSLKEIQKRADDCKNAVEKLARTGGMISMDIIEEINESEKPSPFESGTHTPTVRELCEDAIIKGKKHEIFKENPELLDKCGLLLDVENIKENEICPIANNNALYWKGEADYRMLESPVPLPDPVTGKSVRKIESLCFKFPLTASIPYVDKDTKEEKMRVYIEIHDNPDPITGRLGWIYVLEPIDKEHYEDIPKCGTARKKESGCGLELDDKYYKIVGGHDCFWTALTKNPEEIKKIEKELAEKEIKDVFEYFNEVSESLEDIGKDAQNYIPRQLFLQQTEQTFRYWIDSGLSPEFIHPSFHHIIYPMLEKIDPKLITKSFMESLRKAKEEGQIIHESWVMAYLKKYPNIFRIISFSELKELSESVNINRVLSSGDVEILFNRFSMPQLKSVGIDLNELVKYVKRFYNIVFDDLVVRDVSIGELSFTDCILRGCIFENVRFGYLSFSSCKFYDSAIRSSHTSFPESRIDNLSVSDSHFENIDFQKTSIGTLDLYRSTFAYCNFMNSTINKINGSSTFVGCNFSSATIGVNHQTSIKLMKCTLSKFTKIAFHIYKDKRNSFTELGEPYLILPKSLIGITTPNIFSIMDYLYKYEPDIDKWIGYKWYVDSRNIVIKVWKLAKKEIKEITENKKEYYKSIVESLFKNWSEPFRNLYKIKIDALRMCSILNEKPISNRDHLIRDYIFAIMKGNVKGSLRPTVPLKTKLLLGNPRHIPGYTEDIPGKIRLSVTDHDYDDWYPNLEIDTLKQLWNKKFVDESHIKCYNKDSKSFDIDCLYELIKLSNIDLSDLDWYLNIGF